MRAQRKFRPEFKRQVVDELLGGISTPAQIIRRYEISSGLLYKRRNGVLLYLQLSPDYRKGFHIYLKTGRLFNHRNSRNQRF